MSFKHPSYASKLKGLCCDPAGQLIRGGMIIESRGYPPLDLTKHPKLYPEYYKTKTIKAGKK